MPYPLEEIYRTTQSLWQKLSSSPLLP
jgi:hypothetical protein